MVINGSGLESYHLKSLEKQFTLYWHQAHLLKLREKDVLASVQTANRMQKCFCAGLYIYHHYHDNANMEERG